VEAERAVLRGLGGGCQVPIGAHALVTNDTVSITGIVIAPDGSEMVKSELAGPRQSAADLGAMLAAHLLAQGAAAILEKVL
jgi:hydroxymethylbilane synthase